MAVVSGPYSLSAMVDFPRYRRHATASFWGMFKCLGADAVEMAVPAGTIVKRLDIIGDIGSGQVTGFVDVLLDPFFLQAAE